MTTRTQPAYAPQSLAARRSRQPRSLKLKTLPFALVTAAGLSLGLVGTASHAATIVVNDGGDTSSASVCILRDAMNFMVGGSISGTTGCTNTGGAFGNSDTITFGNAITTINLTQSPPLNYGVFTTAQSLLVQGTGQGGITITRPSANGGLIYHYGGDLTLDGITLTGGRSNNGGAIRIDLNGVDTKLQLKNSVITGNSASSAGAGIYVPSGSNVVATITITNSTISNNTAYGGTIDGAGIYLGGASVLTLSGSTMSGNGNGSTRDGGGIYADARSTVSITNSTLSGNSAACRGAALYMGGFDSRSGSVTFTSSTVAFNPIALGGECRSRAAVFQYGGNITLNNTVMAGNDPVDIGSPDFQTLTVGGTNNLVQNVSSAVTFTNAPLTSDPLLGPLQNNGGVTLTHALLSGSPAINAGGSTILTTDQRGAGFARVNGGTVDIGAFETSPPPVNGVCGSASSTAPVLTRPTSNLCSAGTATPVMGSGPWTWGCTGENGGNTVSTCSATIQTWTASSFVTSGSLSGSISPTPSVTVNNNATTAFTLTPASGYAIGTASGCGSGTLAGNMYTTAAVTGNCNVVAAFTLTPINGTCGAVNGVPAIAAPSANLCSTGTATTVTGTGPWAWSCSPNATGTGTASCAAPIRTWTVGSAVSSGSASGSISPTPSVTVNNNATTAFTLIPASGYGAGTATGCGSGTLAGNTYTTNAVTSNCNVVASFALTPINGTCGAVNGVPAVATPNANLCSTGTATTVTGTGPWAWSCSPNATGTVTASCAAPIRTWTVGSSVGTGSASGSISPTPSVTVNNNAATAFTLTPASGYAAGTASGCGSGTLAGNMYTTVAVTGNCNVVAAFTLTPINGSCGIATGPSAITAPTANLCSTGTATAVTGAGPWAWSCLPNATGTSTANCATNIQVFTANAVVNGGNGSVSGLATKTANYNTTTTFSFTPSAGYQLAAVTGCGTGSLLGSTYTTGAIISNCNVVATFSLIPINGACGSASSVTPALVAPSANLCSTGTATAVSGTGPWTWGCNGNATGASTAANACAVAIRTWVVTPSVSGGNGSIAPSTVVTVNNNAVTSFTVTPSAGYNVASVVGCSGTLSGTTFNTAAILADCAVIARFSAVPRAGITLSGNAVVINNGDTTPATVDGTDFGSLTVGQSATNTFVILNSGTAPLTINSMSFTGPNASDFTITSPTVFPVIIAPNSSLNFSVRFAPSAVGPRSASLLISTDDGVATGTAAAPSERAKALLLAGFSVRGIGVAAEPALPVPVVGLGGLLLSALGLMLVGLRRLRRGE